MKSVLPLTDVDTDEADRTEGAPHPRHASLLIGHRDAERRLLESYRQNRLPHAIILAGQPGIGKATLAWRLARFLIANPNRGARAVVDADDLSVPADGKAAAAVSALSHPDVSLLRREINEKTRRFFTEIRADDVRRAIGLFQRAAGAGGYRICIVDSAEDLNRSSANALLKLIEEPPKLSIFLLIAHRPGLVLPTIRSRAQVVRLEDLQPADVEAVVRSLGPPWSELPPADVSAAAGSSQGSVHGALRRLGRRGVELEQTIRRLLDRLPAVDWSEVHRVADQTLGRNGEATLDVLVSTVFDWLAATVHARADCAPRELEPLAEVWELIAARVRETDALNLDRRALTLSLFADLAEAVRAASGQARVRLAGPDEV